jgi:hypothetical protein
VNIQQAQMSESWAAFMKLAQTARVRNAGFDLPIGRQSAPTETVRASRKTELPAAGNLAKSQSLTNATRPFAATEQPKQILGTKFDAYA